MVESSENIVVPPETEKAPLRQAGVSHLVIVGLGLVGGSLARATRAAFPQAKISGIDRSVILEVAKDEGFIDDGAETENASSFLGEADLVVICLPVLSIAKFLEEHQEALKEGAVITDVGSTKAGIVQRARELGLDRFVGGHPMAGRPQGGLANADADLVTGATWFLCPTVETDLTAVAFARQWVSQVGALPVEIDAQEHDRQVALTSHLPHMLANALAEVVLEGGSLDAAGGSLKEILRVAGASFDVWGDTLGTNEPAVKDALLRLGNKLLGLAEELDDVDRLRDLFARGRACRERLREGEGAIGGD
ncbi:MAG: prephenate dehydrogenase/arogenate dehydrogenase family protein [Deltaproteobacteria bacterium]|nr:prephenate dehydrogenase/arogenate dehydrogenase family protein [Deltaproteobacteria bacterium]